MNPRHPVAVPPKPLHMLAKSTPAHMRLSRAWVFPRSPVARIHPAREPVLRWGPKRIPVQQQIHNPTLVALSDLAAVPVVPAKPRVQANTWKCTSLQPVCAKTTGKSVWWHCTKNASHAFGDRK